MNREIQRRRVAVVLLLAVIASACTSAPAATTNKEVTYAEKDLGSTPLGQFLVETRLENPDWYSEKHGKLIPHGDPENVLGSRWLGFDKKENARGLGIHGTGQPESIGRNMSSGCIRLLNEDAEQLFEIVSRGTTVEVL